MKTSDSFGGLSEYTQGLPVAAREIEVSIAQKYLTYRESIMRHSAGFCDFVEPLIDMFTREERRTPFCVALLLLSDSGMHDKSLIELCQDILPDDRIKWPLLKQDMLDHGNLSLASRTTLAELGPSLIVSTKRTSFGVQAAIVVHKDEVIQLSVDLPYGRTSVYSVNDDLAIISVFIHPDRAEALLGQVKSYGPSEIHRLEF